MSKLIGTNPNQVPSNADLGTAAFMDKKDFLLSKGSSLSAIDAVIPNTAVDVFIYDTSKDSDGGAWRKRTQHTSWYNERLNTPTRGSRREFPAVAVIVAETSKVTIYDGDDPSLPMWMVFEITNNYWLKHTSSTNISASMLNATLVTGGNGATGRASIINFISDEGHVTEALYNYVHRDISKRNIDPVGPALGDIFIVNNSVNDVDMAVLPNAPIDSATGLPTPTLAVVTGAGVSVIKDDGTVVSNSAFGPVAVEITNDGKVYYVTNSGLASAFYGVDYDTIDPGAPNVRINNSGWSGFAQWPSSHFSGLTSVSALDDGDVAYGGDQGVFFSAENDITFGQQEWFFQSKISSSYNTGWMPGLIKLATLSDTDATDITGTELVTNGTFGSSSGWFFNGTGVSVGGGWSIGSGVATSTSTGGDIYGEVSVVSGETYHMSLTVDLTANSGPLNNISLGFRQSNNGGYYASLNQASLIAGSVNKIDLLWTSTLNGTVIARCYSDEVLSLDNWSVRALVEEDRSAKTSGLRVMGTVKKTPVASGSDLVSYSGFSTSNYMVAPRSSVTSNGTEDFSVTAWVKRNVNSNAMRTVGWAKAATNNRFDVYLHSSNQINLYAADGGSAISVTTQTPVGEWFQYTAQRRNSVFELYINGDLKNAGNDSINANYNENLNVWFGVMSFSDGDTIENLPLDGELSMVRISQSSHTAEQIKKMYEDEKMLFQENAKATLYGTSDAVTALAYDEDTNLLHAGTSAGRSVFQGLRRVDNTTRAVSTAISAIDGFVVEE